MLNHNPLILASQSPRRLAILQEQGFTAIVIPADIVEIPKSNESAHDYVLRLSQEKARAIFNTHSLPPNAIILAADTTVELDNQILEKPKDAHDAEIILKTLSNNTHKALTGYTLFNTKTKEEISSVTTTFITFKPLSLDEIQNYIATGDPFDKAGAYGIQTVKNTFVKSIQGSYFNVMGLPIEDILPLLNDFGVKSMTVNF